MAVREGGRELLINLRPPDLGHLTIRVTMTEGVMQAQIIADRPEAARLLQQSLAHLDASLGDLGYSLDSLDVAYSGQDPRDAQSSSRGRPPPGARVHRGRRRAPPPARPPPQPSPATPAGSTCSPRRARMPPITTPAVSGPYVPPTHRPAPKEQTDIFSSDGFLKILAGQIKGQNPLEPMKDTEFIAQMAQFSQLEQITNLAKDMKAIAMSSQLSQGASLIGKNVTYTPRGRDDPRERDGGEPPRRR